MPILTRLELAEHIKTLRPALSPKTIKSYVSLLIPLYHQAFPGSTKIDTNWFATSQDLIIELLKDRTPGSAASILSAVSVLINDSDKTVDIRKGIFDNNRIYQEEQEAGMMSERQKQNWMEYPEIVAIWKHEKVKADQLLEAPPKLQLTSHQSGYLARFLLFTLMAGIYFPPRRAEWLDVKIKNYDTEKDNYLDLENDNFVLNKYKTVRRYGTQRIHIPTELKQFISNYIEKVQTGSDYLLTSRNGTPFTNTNLTDMLFGFFNKNISVNMFRHIYKSYHYKQVPSIAKMREDAFAMGHDLITSLNYIRR
jgi:hypothetical protein